MIALNWKKLSPEFQLKQFLLLLHCSITALLRQTSASRKDLNSPLRRQLRARYSEPGFFTTLCRLHSHLLRTLALALFVFSLLIFFSPNAHADQVTLAWDASRGADGYRLFYRQNGQSFDYSSPDWEGAGTTCTIDLDSDATYYLVVRAYNAYGESGNSNEATITIENPPASALLDYIQMDGPVNVSENTDADYNCRAYYTDGTNLLVEPDTWEVDCAFASISTTGILTTYDVDGDEACQITAYYLEGNITESDTLATTIIDSNGNDPPLSDQLVSNVVVSSGEAYQVMPYGLQLGSSNYIDRTYYFTQIPVYLAGETYIQTANDDKQSTGSDFLSFDVNQDVTVYVAHEDRIEPKPEWLLDFTDTGDWLVSTDKRLRIYAKDFPAGKVTLGGNQGSQYSSMYVVTVTTHGQ